MHISLENLKDLDLVFYRYQCNKTLIYATQIPTEFTLELQSGQLITGKPGDWLVIDRDNQLSMWGDLQFSTVFTLYHNKKEDIIVDLDGTIAEYKTWKGEFHYGKPIKGAKETLQVLRDKGYGITIFTSRHWVEHKAITEYLDKNDIPYDQVICGKPIGIAYIDDRSTGRNGNWKKVIEDLKLNLMPQQPDKGLKIGAILDII